MPLQAGNRVTLTAAHYGIGVCEDGCVRLQNRFRTWLIPKCSLTVYPQMCEMMKLAVLSLSFVMTVMSGKNPIHMFDDLSESAVLRCSTAPGPTNNRSSRINSMKVVDFPNLDVEPACGLSGVMVTSILWGISGATRSRRYISK